VFDIVSSLLDKSLVIKDEVGGIACYRLHETMREYAALKTHEADEEGLLADRYIDYYRTTCLSAAAGARPQHSPEDRPARADCLAQRGGGPDGEDDGAAGDDSAHHHALAQPLRAGRCARTAAGREPGRDANPV
jgi:hypothetical protein